MFEDPVYPPILMGYGLRLTCSVCPEQYDVFVGAEQVGYLRLRHGHFTASAPDHAGPALYRANTQGDGAFLDHERMEHLEAAVLAIDLARRAQGLSCPSSGHAAMEIEHAIAAATAALRPLEGAARMRVALAEAARRLGLGEGPDEF